MSIQPLSHFKGTFKIIFRFDPAIIFLLNFFDEYLGLALDVIPAFTANEWQYWLDILCRMEIMMARLGKHHYRDAIIATLSRTDYWDQIQHPILKTMKENLPDFTEVVVELFFSGDN